MAYSEDFKIFVSTINGEAENCCEISWKVIAHTMRNRIGFANWKSWSNVLQVATNTGYDAYTQKNRPYRNAKKALDSGEISSKLMNLIKAVEPIFNGVEPDFTGGVVYYYSPKAQAQLHKDKPSLYPKLIPDFVVSKSNPTHLVKIPGTENDDMRWYKIITSKFDISFVDIAGNPLVDATVDVIYNDRKPVPLFSDLVTDSKGRIKQLKICNYMGARFKVNKVLVKDKDNKEVSLLGDGNNYSTFIVVNNGKGGIKSNTATHNQTSPPIVPSNPSRTPSNDREIKKIEKENTDIQFNIKLVDSENKIIPNFSYFLKYKGSDKKHFVGNDGVEKNIVADSGELISIEISGKDARQIIKSFTVTKEVSEQIVKFELYRFEILFRQKKSKKVISHLNLIQTYRGKKSNKQTNGEGKILVNAMPGFELNYKLRDGRNLLTIKVDKNKDMRIIDVDSDAVEQAAKNLKEGVKLLQQENQASNTTSKSKQEVQTEDQTIKRDQIIKTSSDGHPKTIVNDNEEVEFTVLTYAEKTNQLFSGGSYIIEYKGNKNTHVSGAHGLGKKIHKAQLGQIIKFFSHNNLIAQIDLQKNMQPIVIKIPKPDISEMRVSGVDWCKLFLQSSSLNDLVEPFKTNATKFINGMKRADITVIINTTWRPDQRSYLMYYSTAIARGQIAVDKVPKFPGVDIDWTHNGNKEAAVRAAKLMYKKYGVGDNPVGKPGSSNHNKKMAIDMKITNYNGKVVVIDGESTEITSWAVLTQLGRKHNVIWYGVKDKPHWSHTGK